MLLEYFLRLLYPPRCMFCEKLLDIKVELEICSQCFDEVPWLLGQQHIQWNSSQEKVWFNEVVGVCQYTGMVKEALVRYKFADRAAYHRLMAELMFARIANVQAYRQAQIIAPVPLHASRELERGYNQACLLSQKLGKKTGISHNPHLLLRTRNTQRQSSLSRRERGNNVREAFSVTRQEDVQGKTIILVDDVFTTGSTLNECSRVLKTAGAEKVLVLVFATGKKADWIEEEELYY